jgi:hypothetical protein
MIQGAPLYVCHLRLRYSSVQKMQFLVVNIKFRSYLALGFGIGYWLQDFET